MWSDDEGVFSHVTALALHELSDALPAKIHTTVPSTWKDGRFALPKHLVLHTAELGEHDTQWLGQVRVTTVGRTIADCIAAKVDPALIERALTQARRRKVITASEHARLRRASLKRSA